MRGYSSGFNPQPEEGSEKKTTCLNSELWHACAGPLVSLPQMGSQVVYLPQGHSEQVVASINKDVNLHFPNYPGLPPQVICHLHNVTMHADVETDEVYAQMLLQPLTPEEQKDICLLPVELGTLSKQPTNYFCKTLTASDTSTHGGFSVPRRAAEKVFPPLDFSQQPPVQELIAKDLHGNEWKFRHIFRGKPKRHLLTTGWSVFVSAKKLVAGDSVIFIWNENNQLLLGVRCATRPQTAMPSSVLSSHSMHIGILAAAATYTPFNISYNPRASPAEFVIPLAKYAKAVYNPQLSIGMCFKMLFETEEFGVRRYMGTIMGIGDLDPVRWPNSHWRSVKVGWNEAGDRQPRVSLWEIEPINSLPMYPGPFSHRLKRPWPPGLPSFPGLNNDDVSINSTLSWLPGDMGDPGIQSQNYLGFGVTPYMQPRTDASMLGLRPNISQAMTILDPSKLGGLSLMQFQQSIPSTSTLQQPNLHESFQENKVKSEPQVLQQQLQCQQSFNEQQQHQQEDSKPIFTLPQMNSATQSQFSNLLALRSSTEPGQIFPDFIGNHVSASSSSSMQSLLSSFSSDGASQFQKLDVMHPLVTPSPSSKRIALEPRVSNGLLLPNSKKSDHSTFLPPLTGKDFAEYLRVTDARSNAFGSNMDSSTLLQNGVSTLKNSNYEHESLNMPFSSSTFSSGVDSDCPLNSDMTASSCVDESGFLHSSENVDQANPHTRTLVHKSGSLGRSLNISKFNSYNELRSELAHMFGLEGLLDDPERSGWQLLFVDRENDVLLIGDDPWQEFVNNVWFIKILSPLEVQQIVKEEGFNLPNPAEVRQRFSNGDNCEEYVSCKDNRNVNLNGISLPLGSLGYY